MLGFIWWFLGVYKVQDTIKEKFVANAIQVEIQHRHFYIVHHAAAAYRTEHESVNNDMVRVFILYN